MKHVATLALLMIFGDAIYRIFIVEQMYLSVGSAFLLGLFVLSVYMYVISLVLGKLNGNTFITLSFISFLIIISLNNHPSLTFFYLLFGIYIGYRVLIPFFQYFSKKSPSL